MLAGESLELIYKLLTPVKEKEYIKKDLIAVQMWSHPESFSIPKINPYLVQKVIQHIEDKVQKWKPKAEISREIDTLGDCSKQQLQKGPFYHYTSDFFRVLALLDNKSNCELNFHQELRAFRTFSVTCSKTFNFIGNYRLTLASSPGIQLKIYSLTQEEYELIRNPNISDEARNYAKNLLEKLDNLRQAGFLDGLHIPLGSFGKEEYETAFFEHVFSEKKLQVIYVEETISNKARYRDPRNYWNLDPHEIEMAKEQFPDIISIPNNIPANIKRGITPLTGIIEKLDTASSIEKKKYVSQHYRKLLEKLKITLNQHYVTKLKITDITDYAHPEGPFIHWEITLD